MPVYSRAQWKPIRVNYSENSISPRFLVVHGIQGSLAGADAWFRDTRAQASAHFGIGKTGTIIQWVNTDDRAWHAVGANGVGIGVEMEMWQGEALTDPQLFELAGLLAWLHGEHGIPVRRAANANDSGLIGHSEGGPAWGGHEDPGGRVLAQFASIIGLAQGQKPPPDEFPPFPYDSGHYLGQPGASRFCHSGFYGGIDHTNVHTWQARMKERGWAITSDGYFGEQSERIARQFQHEKGLAVDGRVGQNTWTATWKAPVT